MKWQHSTNILNSQTMAGFAAAHTIFHFFNYRISSDTTLGTFSKWGYGGTAFVTGGIICLTMFMIFTAAGDNVRHAHYEIFFSAHHFFVLFFIALLLHGPVFWKWSAVPLGLYLWERIMQQRRGDRPFVVNKVEWIEPVMAIQFQPIEKVSGASVASELRPSAECSGKPNAQRKGGVSPPSTTQPISTE